MEPFAIIFMGVSMFSVTLLAGFCMARILRGGPPAGDDEGNSWGGGP